MPWRAKPRSIESRPVRALFEWPIALYCGRRQERAADDFEVIPGCSMKTPSAGYSGTPLAKKLGIKEGTSLLVENTPPDYADLIAPLPENVTLQGALSSETDIIHVFSDRKTKLKAALKRLRKSIKSDAAVWVSWPKKASKVPTDITEDTIRELALPIGFVDVKVCAVSEIWSGLKLVIRKELRGR